MVVRVQDLDHYLYLNNNTKITGMLFLVKKEAKMPIKKKNNQPVRVSLRKRLLIMFTYIEIYIKGILLKVQSFIKKIKTAITKKK